MKLTIVRTCSLWLLLTASHTIYEQLKNFFMQNWSYVHLWTLSGHLEQMLNCSTKRKEEKGTDTCRVLDSLPLSLLATKFLPGNYQMYEDAIVLCTKKLSKKESIGGCNELESELKNKWEHFSGYIHSGTDGLHCIKGILDVAHQEWSLRASFGF